MNRMDRSWALVEFYRGGGKQITKGSRKEATHTGAGAVGDTLGVITNATVEKGLFGMCICHKKGQIICGKLFVFSMVSSAMPQSRRGSRTIASCTDIVICLPRNACLLLSWAKIPARTEIPVSWTIFPGFNGQDGSNRRAAMAEHADGGRTRSPTALLRSARNLHFNIPTF